MCGPYIFCVIENLISRQRSIIIQQKQKQSNTEIRCVVCPLLKIIRVIMIIFLSI